uniref:Uncharacterized protein n=1 Tax=Siphoviridae sp. ctvGX2 TaxID=2826512 RepID=A0A8S5LYQ1_9CAUD|nr:MAG TPA: hypothetical protein [Siphoviridae sp. ctvGX2]
MVGASARCVVGGARLACGDGARVDCLGPGAVGEGGWRGMGVDAGRACRRRPVEAPPQAAPCRRATGCLTSVPGAYNIPANGITVS